MSDAYFSNTCLDFPVSTDIGPYNAMAKPFSRSPRTSAPPPTTT